MAVDLTVSNLLRASPTRSSKWLEFFFKLQVCLFLPFPALLPLSCFNAANIVFLHLQTSIALVCRVISLRCFWSSLQRTCVVIGYFVGDQPMRIFFAHTVVGSRKIVLGCWVGRLRLERKLVNVYYAVCWRGSLSVSTMLSVLERKLVNICCNDECLLQNCATQLLPIHHGPYVWRANSPSNHLVTTLKQLMCEAQIGIGLSDWVKCVKFILIFLCLSSLNTIYIKMGALMLPLTTVAIIEEKTNSCTDGCHPMNHWKPQIIQENLDSHDKAHQNQHRRWRGHRKILNGKGLLGHW